MSNSFYNHGFFPSTGSAATSATMRAELDLVSAGFDKMPTLSGNANAVIVVNGSGTGLTATNVLPITSGGTGKASAPAAQANLLGYTTTVTGSTAGTTTLTNTSSFYQLFTGSLAQTVVLPDTSTLQLGWSFRINNSSTDVLTINSSGGSLVRTLVAGATLMCTCIDTTAVGVTGWRVGITEVGSSTGSANLVLSNSPTITGTLSFTGGAGNTSNFHTTQTTGVMTIGGTLGTGQIIFGRSTVSQQTDIQAGITSTGNTKTINIGTGGASGSTTNITLGSSTSGATSATTLNGAVTCAKDATINGVTVGLGAGAVTSNVAVGVSALQANTSGTSTTAVGTQAAYSSQTGVDNTAIGYQSAFFNVSGTRVTAVGHRAGLNTTGSYNTFVGAYSGVTNGSGTNNTFVGDFSGNLTTGGSNTFVGQGSGQTTSSGVQNAFFGYNSGYGVTTGSNNVIVGAYTGAAAPISATGSNWIVLSDGAGNVRQTIDSSGNVGVGVTPSAWGGTGVKALDVAAATSLAGSAGSADMYCNTYFNGTNFVFKASGYAGRYSQNVGVGYHAWYVSNNGTAGGTPAFTQAMTLDASGNLMVGNTTAGGRLTVQGNVSTSATITNISQLNGGIRYNGNAGVYETESGLTFQAGNAGGGAAVTLRRGGSYETSLDFYINNVSTAGACARAMTLDYEGSLLLGTATSAASNSNSLLFSPSSKQMAVQHATGTTTGTNYINFLYAAAGIGSITQNGTTGVLYNLTSDYRLKNNQEALTGAKDFIMALKPKKWQWWDGSGEGVGFVAHEFMEVAKHSGHGEKDAVETIEIKDDDGNTTVTEERPIYQSIQPSSSEVMANLVSFIQEQQALITSLTARLDSAGL